MVSIFDEKAREYDMWFDKKGSIIFPMEVEAIKAAIAGIHGPMLEVGVGSGRFAKEIGIPYGIDPSQKLLKMAAKRGIKVVMGKGENLPFKDSSFNASFMIVTICFVEDPPLVLKEIKRTLKDKGYVVLGLVLKESPWGKFYLEKKKEGHPFYQHASFYTFSEIEDMLQKEDFHICRVVSTLFQPPGKVKEYSSPKEGYHQNAGFTVIVARKT